MRVKVAPSAKMFNFLKELLVVIPNIYYYPRKKNALKMMIEWAKEKDMSGADRWALCGRLNAGKWKSGFENWGCQPQ